MADEEEEVELLRASLCGPGGYEDHVEAREPLDSIKAKADEKFPADKVVVIQGEDTADGERLVQVRGWLRGRVLSKRYPTKDGPTWRDET